MSENSVVLAGCFPAKNPRRSGGSEIYGVGRRARSRGQVPRFRQMPLALLPLALMVATLQCSGFPPQSNSTQAGPKRRSGVVVVIVDENGVAVPSVQISFVPRGAIGSEGAYPIRGETDYAG